MAVFKLNSKFYLTIKIVLILWLALYRCAYIYASPFLQFLNMSRVFAHNIVSNNLHNLLKVGTSLPSKDSHKGYILYGLLCGRSSNNIQMSDELNTCYSGSRISELRKDGWIINDRPLKGASNPRSKDYFIETSMLVVYLDNLAVQHFMRLCSEKISSAKIMP